MVITFDDFALSVKNWCASKGKDFKYYWPLKGGWEYWVQAEVAAYMISKDPTDDILREQHIFRNYRKKVDWLFNDSDPDPRACIAIELKCQSFENQGNFIREVQKDILKLSRTNMYDGYKDCQKGVMGIYFEPKAQKWMKDNGFTEIHVGEDVGCAIRRL